MSETYEQKNNDEKQYNEFEKHFIMATLPLSYVQEIHL